LVVLFAEKKVLGGVREAMVQREDAIEAIGHFGLRDQSQIVTSRYVNGLKIDLYFPKYNLAIECD
jgi:hypothetical protein